MPKRVQHPFASSPLDCFLVERSVQSCAHAARAFFRWLVHRETFERNPLDRVAFPRRFPSWEGKHQGFRVCCYAQGAGNPRYSCEEINDGYGYYGYGNIALEVARAAEETRPREARELYRQHAERLIALRGRQNYQEACKYLAKIRALDEQLGENEAWTSYITALREQNRNLRALKEELANAGL